MILKAWKSSSSIQTETPTHNVKIKTEISIEPKKNFVMPFYSGSEKAKKDIYAPYRWVLK